MLALALTGATAGAARLDIADFEMTPGGSYTASVSIIPDGDGMFDYRGLQFDLGTLPAGVAVDMQASSTMSRFNLRGADYGDGNYRLLVFTDGDNPSVNTTESILSIAFTASEQAAPGQYTIDADKVYFSTPKGQDVVAQGCSFVITIKAKPVEPDVPEVPEKPSVPTTPIPDGWHGNDNGTYVSALKIREGNELGMGVNYPTGGYENDFSYLWKAPDAAEIGSEREIWTEALLYGEAAKAGKQQAVSSNVYNVTVSNFDPDGNMFWTATLPTATVEVYKRPQIPTQLLRKGQGNPEVGTSCTFVVMMTPLTNEEILNLGYTYTYGYTDRQGVMHELETTPLRYTHTTREIYWNPDYTFWAYSRWTYPDGSVVTSGLRFLDGGEDPDFDASEFTGTRGSGVKAAPAEGDDAIIGIYTLDGRHAGTDASLLPHGIYIIRTTNSAKKVIL